MLDNTEAGFKQRAIPVACFSAMQQHNGRSRLRAAPSPVREASSMNPLCHAISAPNRIR
jgi:hypothetical protein